MLNAQQLAWPLIDAEGRGMSKLPKGAITIDRPANNACPNECPDNRDELSELDRVPNSDTKHRTN
jgi:hypothetical protein